MLKQDSHQQHISEQFNADLEKLKSQMLEMGGKVERQLNSAVTSLVNMDSAEAEQTIERDSLWWSHDGHRAIRIGDWKLVANQSADGMSMYVVDMKSQTWLGSDEVDRTVWQHYLTIIKPDTAKASTALMFRLMVSCGSWIV